MRLLLIARHYPPAVSGGARRPYLLARALRARGCAVFVAAPGLPDGEDGRAVPHPHRDPGGGGAPRARTLRDTARELLLWPDPDIRWSRRAGAAAIAAGFRPDWVWTTSPPESIHAAGLMVKRATGARWLADFRDHWLDRPHRLERAAPHRRFGERLIARSWLGRADLVTAVDRFVAAELAALGATRVEVLEHFRPPDIAEPVALDPADLHVVHTGSIALSDPEAQIEQILAPFTRALARNPRLRLHFVGRLTDEESARARSGETAGRVALHGVVPFARALGWQRAADALIYVGSPKTRVPPSKIVEYLAASAPIIACGTGSWRSDPRVSSLDPEDALASLVRGAGRDPVAAPPTLDAAADQFLALLQSSD